MANDISGYGASVRVLASNTFPIGVDITEFADDADPIDFSLLEITNKAMGLNGNKVSWTVANPIEEVMNLIPGSDDDKNMQRLFEANRAGRGKASAKDVITVVLTYPDGGVTTLSGGTCDSFMPARSFASEGRMKSMPYNFSFENRVSI